MAIADTTSSTTLKPFLVAATQWAREHGDIVGLALVGSHARGAARPDSDVDLCVLCKKLESLIDNQNWVGRFGNVLDTETERYGPTRSVRVFYESGLEVEFGVADPAWASLPLDAGTRRVISDGMEILYDPIGLLGDARDAAARPGEWNDP